MKEKLGMSRRLFSPSLLSVHCLWGKRKRSREQDSAQTLAGDGASVLRLRGSARMRVPSET